MDALVESGQTEVELHVALYFLKIRKLYFKFKKNLGCSQ
jgi:hypothetical protein